MSGGGDTDLWSRALRALEGAESNLGSFPEITAGRCYYAAFHALSALFMLKGKTFKSHGGVERAVHRDLVHTGTWSAELGNDYSRLFKLRLAGDYGTMHVRHEEAQDALIRAKRIIQAVSETDPDQFRLPGREGEKGES